MSFDPYGPHKSRDCYYARYNPPDSMTNVDVDGIAVGVANVVVGVCLRILITWSPEIDIGVQGSLFQIYPILISTLLSIDRQQLSLFDVNYALVAASSPLTIYLVFASIGDLFGLKIGLGERIKHRHVIRTLLLLVPFLWIGLSATLRLSNAAFADSELCRGSTFKDWLTDLCQSFVDFIAFPGGIFPSWAFYPLFGSLFGLCLFRRRSQVMTYVRTYWKGASKPWGRLQIPWVFVKRAWRTVDGNHKWYTYFLFGYLDLCWAMRVIGYTLQAATWGYVLSYGQLLSVFAALPPFMSTVKFIYSHRWDLLHFLRRFPALCRAEVKYLATGIELDPPAKDNYLPFTHQPLPESRSAMGVDGGEAARPCADGTASREVSPPEEVTASPPDPPVLAEPQRDHVPSERARPPTPLSPDVPLAMVHDVILTLLRNKTFTESIESICVTHQLDPLITESIMQVVRENQFPVDEQCDMNVVEPSSSVVSANVTTAPTAPLTLHEPTAVDPFVHTNTDTGAR